MDDIRQDLIRIDAMQGVVTETQKEQLMGSYKNLVLSCAKALIPAEVGRQKLERLKVEIFVRKYYPSLTVWICITAIGAQTP